MRLPRAIVLHPNDGGLTFARALARRGVDVVALTTDEFRYVLASRWVDGRVMPDIRRDPEAWLDLLTNLGDEGEAVVICASDAASEWVSQHSARLPSSLRTFESTDGVHLALMDKFRLYSIAQEIGVRVPWMRVFSSRTALEEARTELEYPCVLKAALAHLAKKVLGYGTVLVESAHDVMRHAGPLLDNGIEVLLTEVVPGPETGLEGAVQVRDRDGRYALEYGRRKIRQWPLDYGVGSLVEAASVPETVAMSRRLLDHVGYYGLAACETKRHVQNGELYLIEINVRMPGTFGLAEACGVDGSWRTYATLAGLPLAAQPRQVDGRKVMLPHKELAAVGQRLRRGDVGVAEALLSWRGTRDVGALHWRDPLPAMHLASQLARKILSEQPRKRDRSQAVV